MLAAIIGWGRTLWTVWTTADRIHLGLISAGVAFFAMFALFPALAALIAVFGLVADPNVVADLLVLVEDLIPVAAYDLIEGQIDALLSAGRVRLQWTTVLSILIAMWSARAGVAAMMRGLNAIYGQPMRGGLRHYLVAFTLTVSLIGMAGTVLLVVVIAPVVLSWLPLTQFSGLIVTALRWAAVIAILVAGLGILYRFGPNRRGRRPAWITPGAFVVILLWGGASAGFSLYLTNFGSYNEVYGSIGAAAAMLMWLYISAYLVLLGAVLNRVIEEGRTPVEEEVPGLLPPDPPEE